MKVNDGRRHSDSLFEILECNDGTSMLAILIIFDWDMGRQRSEMITLFLMALRALRGWLSMRS